jgi:hypothetical protein
VTADRLWLPPGVERLARREDAPDLDLSPFVRAAQDLGLTANGGYSGVLDMWVQSQVRQSADPAVVPLRALQAMGTHPVVYLAERTITGLIRRPNLYYVSHPEKRIVKETEEWLWPLLPVLLEAAARAFAYGSVPVILNWGTRDLRIEVPRYEGGVRSRTLKEHVHYVSAHEVWPGDAKVRVEDDELLAVEVDGRSYDADRAHVLRWDAEFGSWAGQGARRRAWTDYAKSLAVTVLQSRYLERSVDSPRVAWAPPATLKVDGADIPGIRHVNQLLLALRGSGAVTFPSTRDANGQKRYELEVLDLPDRKDVWHQALNRYDAGILKAYLVPPSLAGIEDLAAAGARILDGMLREFIQDLATYAADNLTRLVARVHAVNYDPAKVAPPTILAYEVPAAVRKLYLEVLRLIGAAKSGEAPADWVDVPALLDQLGVPLRTAPVEKQEGGGVSGRAPDLTSGQQERREDARTDDPGDATPAPEEEAAS